MTQTFGGLETTSSTCVLAELDDVINRLLSVTGCGQLDAQLLHLFNPQHEALHHAANVCKALVPDKASTIQGDMKSEETKLL